MATPPMNGLSHRATAHDCDDSRRLRLLAATATDLLTHSDPKVFLQLLFDRLAAYCGLEVCFSYWVVGNRLQLGFSSGVRAEVAAGIEWLDYGQAVCGTVARERCVRVAEHIQERPDPLTTLVRSFGVQAYCCHPLIAGDKLLGTLSFGTRTRPTFNDDEIALMKTVSDQVAAGLERFLFVREIGRKNAELERANEDLRQFAYAASHDLQEPVRTIISYTQLLLRTASSKLDGREREILGFVSNGAEQLHRLLAGLLTYTHVSAGSPDREYIEVNQAIGDALASCRALLDSSGATVSVDAPSLCVRANRSQLSRVFQNLLTNAVKYGRESESPRIAIVCSVAHGEMTIGVSDNGQGIEPRYRDLVFQLFKRLHGREIPGSGIGLATSRRIVEHHGRRIWVESTPGGGSTFFFTLPVEEQRRAAFA